MSPPVQLKAFATTSPGLEGALADELATLGMGQVRKGKAGCAFRADRTGLERATMGLRTAHRVLWTLGDIDAADGDELYRGVRAVARWQGLIPADKTFAIDATCRDTPAFRDARFAGLRAKDAIVDAVRDATGARPDVSVDDPDVVVRLSIARGRGVVSLDCAGKTSLHMRGYRIEAGEAPLRESLAAALSMLAGWDGRDANLPLVDPMCGSGTILIEAALRARNIAPAVVSDAIVAASDAVGTARALYGFMRWPGFRPERYDAALAELKGRVRPDVAAQILGFDHDPHIIAVARGNAMRAGVADDVRFAPGDARTLGGMPEAGVLVTNPPWGARLGDRDTTVSLLRAVAAHWSRPQWRAAVLVPDADTARAAGLTEKLVPLEAGGREVLLAIGRFGQRPY